jgi:hypothetical protein
MSIGKLMEADPNTASGIIFLTHHHLHTHTERKEIGKYIFIHATHNNVQ